MRQNSIQKLKKKKTKEKKKKKGIKKKKLKFKDYKHCLEATQPENKINQLKKDKIDIDHIWENHKDFIKNYILILKTQQRLRIKNQNTFAQVVSKIALSTTHDKRAQSVVKTSAYEANEEIIHWKEEIKWETMTKLQKKKKYANII